MKNVTVCVVAFLHVSQDGMERRVGKVGLYHNHRKEASL
jgi:hypothetical protein